MAPARTSALALARGLQPHSGPSGHTHCIWSQRGLAQAAGSFGLGLTSSLSLRGRALGALPRLAWGGFHCEGSGSVLRGVHPGGRPRTALCPAAAHTAETSDEPASWDIV